MLMSNGMPGGGQVWHQAGLDAGERRRLHGEGSWRMATTLEAGSAVAVEFTFAIGETEIPAGGKLRVAWRWPFDWAEPTAGASVLLRQMLTQHATAEVTGLPRELASVDPRNDRFSGNQIRKLHVCRPSEKLSLTRRPSGPPTSTNNRNKPVILSSNERPFVG